MNRLLSPGLLALALISSQPCLAQQFHVYLGCYTNAKSGAKGIQLARFDAGTGNLSEVGLAAEAVNPSFVAIDPKGQFLYAVGEIADSKSKRGGGLSAFAIEQPSGKLRLINQVSAVGQGPCHVGLDADARMAMIANYGSGSVASYAIGHDGALSEHRSFFQHEGSGADPRRQKGPHAHSFNRSPDNRFGFACDLGLDKVLVYRLNPADGSMTKHGEVSLPPGAGPRHFAFHPGGLYAFVNNEMGMSLSCFAYDAQKGELKLLATESTLPAQDRQLTGLSTAEVVAHPNGRTVYVSNRTHDTIAVFAFDAESGQLKLLENVPAEGKIPRNFALDPTGRWMLVGHQDSNSVAVFAVDAAQGRLKFTGQRVSAGAPVCVRFLPVRP